VSPYRLDFPVTGSTASARLNIFNIADANVRYEIYVQEEQYKSWFEIEPSAFGLQPGTSQTVELTVRPSENEKGQHRAVICVLSLASDGESATAGAKIPADITIESGVPLLPIVMPVSALAALVAVYCLYILRRNRVKGAPERLSAVSTGLEPEIKNQRIADADVLPDEERLHNSLDESYNEYISRTVKETRRRLGLE
jgi:hypothetical protein